MFTHFSLQRRNGAPNTLKDHSESCLKLKNYHLTLIVLRLTTLSLWYSPRRTRLWSKMNEIVMNYEVAEREKSSDKDSISLLRWLLLRQDVRIYTSQFTGGREGSQHRKFTWIFMTKVFIRAARMIQWGRRRMYKQRKRNVEKKSRKKWVMRVINYTTCVVRRWNFNLNCCWREERTVEPSGRQ